MPLISVVVATYNCAATLQQCIDSFVRQTYQNKELIVIDGGSKDGTVALLEKNREHISYCLSEPDRGIYNAWNKALPQAKGDWICFLGADDFFWDEKVLATMSGQLEKLAPAICVAYGRVMVLDSDGNTLYPVGEPWHKIKTRIKSAMCIPHPGAMHSRSLFERHGYFDESFRIAADYELLLRELPMADAHFVPELIVAGMRQGGISSTSGNLLIALEEIRRAQRMHGYCTSWLKNGINFTSAILRLCLIKLFGDAWVRRMINRGKQVKFARH